MKGNDVIEALMNLDFSGQCSGNQRKFLSRGEIPINKYECAYLCQAQGITTQW